MPISDFDEIKFTHVWLNEKPKLPKFDMADTTGQEQYYK